jgi:Domain of unknown function (DUF4167)
MRPSNKSRSRNKSGNNPNRRNIGNVVNRVFESAGPDGKVRGTPQQIIDKYQALARDAQVSGDRVAAENYLQHAEHYTRLLGEAQRQMQDNRFGDRDDRDDRDRDDRDRDDREDRDDGQPQRERERMDDGDRPQHRHEPARREEPSGLTTLGAEDGDGSGPVETPEEAARRRDERVTAAPREAPTAPVMNGEHRAAEPGPEQEAPVKRPRTRRKAKAVVQEAEAGAE